MRSGGHARLLTAQSDARLVELVHDGSERAFEALVDRYRKPLLRYCRRLSLTEATAEDVLHEALLEAWLALRAGTGVREPKAWLYGIVRNTAIDAVRRAERERERFRHQPIQGPVGAQTDPDRALAVRGLLADLAALPPLQREAIVRSAIGGASREQVAEQLGISDSAVRGLIYRARARLRSAATALTPPSLLAWLGGAGGGGSERLAAVIGGGAQSAGGIGGAILKGGAVLAATGTLLTGIVAVRDHAPARGHHAHARRSPLRALASAAPGGNAAGPAVSRPASRSPSGSAAPAPSAPHVRSPGRESAPRASAKAPRPAAAPAPVPVTAHKSPSPTPSTTTTATTPPPASAAPSSPVAVAATSEPAGASTTSAGGGGGEGAGAPPAETGGSTAGGSSGSSGSSGGGEGHSGGLVGEVLHTVGGVVGGLLNP